MNYPDNIFYTQEHMWAQQLDDGSWAVGITDYAQDLLGDIVFVEPPKLDTDIIAGDACGLVESVKTGSDLHAPINATITAINEAVLNAPELINDAPYDNWIFKCQASDDNTDLLLSAEDYQALI